MTEIFATVRWQRQDAPFTDNKYSRRHFWEFDGGTIVPASSSPHIVPVPMSDITAVDPEESFVASLSSCHMLCFLSIAAKRGFIVDQYEDKPVGNMGRNGENKIAIKEVTLRPKIQWTGTQQPQPGDIGDMHHHAHEECFIANSVKTLVQVKPILH